MTDAKTVHGIGAREAVYGDGADPSPSIWPAFAVWTGRLASALIEDRRCGCCLRVGVG